MRKSLYSKAFTLVELIVVITILAILWTISFIALQWYSADARDARRLSDVRSLLSKIAIERIKWVDYATLMSNSTWTFLTINWTPNKPWYQGTVNFANLREEQTNFQDPQTGADYPFAYTVWTTILNWNEIFYDFYQMAYRSERSWEIKYEWNYFKYAPNDSENLFTISFVEKILEWNNNNEPEEPEDWVTHNPIEWTITVTYGWQSIIIADKNVWATEVYNWEIEPTNADNPPAYRWKHFQWWRNVWFPITNWVLNPAQSQIPFTQWETNPNFIWNSSLARWDWSETQEDDAWSWVNIKWPCDSWYHVPTTQEWKDLVGAWFAIKFEICDTPPLSFCDWSWNASLFNFKNDLKLPLAGLRYRNTGILYSGDIGGFGAYWTSSPSDTLAHNLGFYSDEIWVQDHSYRAFGLSIRCFKN
jgi:prepilin-type N-terminal cleavage/methylation domain-containing protein